MLFSMLNSINSTMAKVPENCSTLNDLRLEIDRIDRDILSKLGERFKYVKRIPEFKEDTKESIVAQERYNELMLKRREWAEEENLNPEVIEQIYKQLVAYFIDEQMKIKNL